MGRDADSQQNDTENANREPSQVLEATGTVTHDVAGASKTHTSHPKGANEGQVCFFALADFFADLQIYNFKRGSSSYQRTQLTFSNIVLSLIA
jgi:hypothetical protein